MNEAPELRTRKPTGKPPWPLILLAGAEKSGKSWCAADFSSSDLVDRTFYIELGEGYADEYGAIPGARYEIVEHDGTYQGIGYAVWAATQQPRPNGKPHAIVFDSITLLWEMLSEEASREAVARWHRKNPKRDKPAGEITVGMDIWNTATDRWYRILKMLRTYDGPVIVTARLDQVTVVADGKPTDEKALKVKAQKALPFDVDVIVQIPAFRKYQITGLRSVRWHLPESGVEEAPGFTVDWMLRKLGLDEQDATSPRTYIAPAPEDPDEAGARQQQRPRPQHQPQRKATPEQKQQLAILCGQKLGHESRPARLAAMSGRFQRAITSFDDLFFTEAAVAIGELKKKPDFVKPRDEKRYQELRAQIARADLDSIGDLEDAITEARDAEQITAEDWDHLSDMAAQRTKAVIADAAGERDWVSEDVPQPEGAST